MTIGSLFSGIGLLERGLELAGFGPVSWHAEVDPYCRAVLHRHWPKARSFSDVREVSGGTADAVDVVCGGFPCQPFSVAGRRRGLSDDRWLWPEYARIVEEVRPAVVVGENVPGLRKAGLPIVLADLARLGFDAEWASFSASSIGAPHRRNRIWIVATHPERMRVRLQRRPPSVGGWLARAIGEAQAFVAGSGQAWPPAYADRLRELQPEGRLEAFGGWAGHEGWWEAPPAIRGVDDVRSDGLDMRCDAPGGCRGEACDHEAAPDAWRISALGNAVVGACSYLIGRALSEAT